ncbi:MAG TPA: guanitoxin biosynthesis MBL fold metallo-hydrolase GntH [Gemmataceae bacterium]|nr:guanitoxin biosynthesis MBL fold metallo-hydrolase GntH [Gemmataceae bacterium]
MKKLNALVLSVLSVCIFLAVIALAGPRDTSSGPGAETPRRGPEREGLGTYFPDTEKLGAAEMRVIACGTGLPLPRKSQAATCFLVELGNGEKFLFDLGSESAANLGCLNIPYDHLDKLFVSHLHSDHVGDMANLWIGGWVGGRHGPLRVWGPSGLTPDLGTKHFVESLKETFKWDYKSRLGVIPASGGGIEVHEFDYRGENKIVYEKNGVTIRSWPAIHCMDGPVSYALEWNGLKFVFGGDTFPNKWYARYAKNADLAIHECFPSPPMLMKYEHLSARSALNVAVEVHTVPHTFGIVMNAVKPRMAVAYHFFNDYDTRDPIYDGIRKVYKGPLTMATDLLVWNVTKENVKVRRVIVNEASWPASPPTPPDQPDPKQRTPFSAFVDNGRADVAKELAPQIEKFKKEHGLK